MSKHLAKFLSVFLAMVVIVVCGVSCSTGTEAPSKVTTKSPISQDTEFGSVVVQIGAKDFKKLGFEYGDSCNISFSNGKTYKDVPFFSGYYGKSDQVIIVDYQGTKYLLACRCFGDSLWGEAECKKGDAITITLQEKGKYKAQQVAMNMTYSDDRKDYASDEVFANFRVISCKNLADGKFFRGASPVDNLHNRAKIVDGLLKKHGIKYVLDLADTEEKLNGYRQRSGFASDYYMSLYSKKKVALVGMTAAYRTETNKKKLIKNLREMIQSEGPCYIHCTEGKDRTGFVCLLLECVAGCSLEDIEADYMKTYDNYFGLTKSSDAKMYQAVMDARFYDMMNWLAGVEKSTDLKKADFRKAAKSYLISGGMTEEEFAKLVTFVTKK